MNKKILFMLLPLLLISCDNTKKLFDSSQSFNDKNLLIIDHAPKEEVSFDHSQIRITFNQKMREMGGRNDVTSYFSATPMVNCKFEWVSETTVVCHLDKNLKKSTKYKIDFKKGIKDLKGLKLKSDYSFEFISSAPKLMSSTLSIDKKIPTAHLVLTSDIEVDRVESSFVCGDKNYKATLLKDEKREHHYDVTLNPAELNFPLKNCEFIIVGDLKATEGELTNKIDLKIKADQVKLADETFSKMTSNFNSISCSQASWYRATMANEKLCPNSKEVSFYLHYRHSFTGSQLVEVSPQVNNFNVKIDNPRKLTVSADFEVGKTYSFRFSAGQGLSDNVVVNIGFINAPPAAKMNYSNAIIEKTGPHRLPFQVKNIDSFDIEYVKSNSVSELPRVLQMADTYGRYNIEGEKTKKKTWEMPNLKLNEGRILPIEFDSFGEKTNGFYIFNFKSKDVKAKAIEAHKKLFDSTYNSNSSWSRTYKEYSFDKTFSVLITDIGLHVKKGYLNHLVWVFDIPSGLPLKNANVALYNQGDLVEQIKTDEFGLALFGKKDFTHVIASKDDDYSFVSVHNYTFQRGISTYSFNIPYAKIEDSRNFVIESISDRPLYKPGDQVRLKIYVRKWDLLNLQYVHEDSKKINVGIRNSRGEVILKKDIKLGEFSTASLDFELKKDAVLGNYSVEVRPEYAAYSTRLDGFKVQEYKVSPFKVESRFDKKLYVRGDKATLKTTSSYFFGGAYKNAKGQFVLGYIPKVYRPKNDNYRYFRFHDANHYDYYNYFYGKINQYPRELTRESFTTNNKGEGEISVSTNKINEDVLTGVIYAKTSVEGESGNEISSEKSAKFLNSTYVLGAKFKQWSYKVGSKLSPQVVVFDKDEKIKEGVSLEFELFKENWKTTRRLGGGNYFYFDSQREEVSVGKCKFKSNKKLETCSLEAKENGAYISYIRGLDSNGNSIHVKNRTWVYGGAGYTNWSRYNHERIDLLPEKYSYKLGEKAKIMIRSPFKNVKALITVERYGIIKKEIIEIKGNTHIYELPIDDSSYAPGIYLSAVLLKGRHEAKVEGNLDLGKPSFKIGYVKLSVSDNDLKLSVDVKADKKKLKPKEKIKLKVDIKDLKNEKGPYELAIAVVDEAVLQLAGNYRSQYQLFSSFYKVPSLAVENYQTLVKLIGRQTYGKKGGTAGGGGGLQELRDNFMAVAYWNPHLKTNENGQAEVEFTVPDNLTTWKVLVVANDKTRKFGYGEDNFMVTKQVLVEPVVPVFLTEGDTLDTRMVVHNKSQKSLNIKTTIDSQAFSPKKSEQNISVRAGEKQKVKVRLKSNDSGVYDLYMSAESKLANDRLKIEFPIIPLETHYVEGLFGHTIKDSVSIPYMVPQDIKKGSQQLELKISSTLLTGLRDSFQYVLKYPYGCWEQRLTKAMYLAYYRELRPYVGEIDHGFKDAKEKIQELLNQASKYQGRSGGMKFYPGAYNDENPYLSAFTASQFLRLKELGFSIPKTVSDNLNQYLKNMLTKDNLWPVYYKTNHRQTNIAMILDILKSHDVKGLDGEFTKLITSFSSLSLLGKSFILNAMFKEKGRVEKSKNLLDNLVSNMDIQAAKAQFKSDKSYFLASMLDTNLRSQCAMLSTLMKIKPESENVSKLLNFIDSAKVKGRWYNTQENIFCFQAFYRYSKLYEKQNPKFSFVVDKNKSKVFKGSLDLKNKNMTSQIDIKDIGPGQKSKLDISKKGQGRLYYHAWLKYSKKELPKERVNQGFSLTKEMYVFNESLSNWVKLSGNKTLKLGDIVKVRLKITTKGQRTHVGLNDPFAAAFTPVNTELATTSTTSKAFTTDLESELDYKKASDFNFKSAFRFMDMRKTAVQFYAPFMKAGTYGLEYDVRVTSSGEFSMNAPSVEEMYYPDIRGVGLGRKIIVND